MKRGKKKKKKRKNKPCNERGMNSVPARERLGAGARCCEGQLVQKEGCTGLGEVVVVRRGQCMGPCSSGRRAGGMINRHGELMVPSGRNRMVSVIQIPLGEQPVGYPKAGHEPQTSYNPERVF